MSRPPTAAGRPGLLEYVAGHSLDEDYAYVASRRREGDRPRLGPLGAVAVVAFALIVAVAGARTARNAGTVDAQRRDLAGQVAGARDQLRQDRADLARLQADTASLQAAALRDDAANTGALARLRLLGGWSGTLPVTGPGVRVVVDDAPHAQSDKQRVLDSDLQRLVNGLWEAGAEAISLNGQRLTNLSTIRLAGRAITVNEHSLRRPYVVSAVGDRDTLPARFAETSSGQAWLDLQRQVGLRLRITPVDRLTLPAADVGSLRWARTLAPGSTGRTGTTSTPGSGGTR